LVEVPSIFCMTKRQAQDTLAAAGFTITFSGSGKRVTDQDPAPKTKYPKGSSVTAFLSPGAICV